MNLFCVHENYYAQKYSNFRVREIKSARKFSNFAQPECAKISTVRAKIYTNKVFENLDFL